MVLFIFFFKRKTAYEMRISDWSSDVCSSDLARRPLVRRRGDVGHHAAERGGNVDRRILPALCEFARKHDIPVEDRAGGIDHRLILVVAIGEHCVSTEEPRVGKECVRTWRSRCAAYISKKKRKNNKDTK